MNLVPGATPPRFQNADRQLGPRALERERQRRVNRNNNVTRVDGAASCSSGCPTTPCTWLPRRRWTRSTSPPTTSTPSRAWRAARRRPSPPSRAPTNFRGSAFCFPCNKTQRLSAGNTSTPASLFRRRKSITGFTVGGPIIKNKLFYFGGWEGYRERLGFERLNETVATAMQRAGDFSELDTVDPIFRLYDPSTGDPTTGWPDDLPGRDDAGQTGLTLTVKCRTCSRCRTTPRHQRRSQPTFPAAGTRTLDRDNFDSKINWNVNDSFSLWGRYSAMDAQFSSDAALGEAQGVGLCNGAAGSNNTLDQTSAIGFTKTFSPTFLWDSVVGWTRHTNDSGDFVGFGTNFGSDVLGIPGTEWSGPAPERYSAVRYQRLLGFG